MKKLNYTNEFEMVKAPLLDPDSVMAYLFFQAKLKISAQEVSEFWNMKRGSGEERAMLSPATTEHIPIAVYGDSCRLYNGQPGSKYLGIFISLPLWRPHSTRYSRWCIFSMECAKLFGRETLHPILQRITYKLNLLFENGVEGPDGQKLKFSCTEIRGDWEWHKQLFDLTSSWKSIANVCFRCTACARAANPKKLYYCLDDDADWTEFSLTEFLATQIKNDLTCTQVPT